MADHEGLGGTGPHELAADGWCWVDDGVQGRIGAQDPVVLVAGPAGGQGGPDPQGDCDPQPGRTRASGPRGPHLVRVALMGVVILVLTVVGVAAARPMTSSPVTDEPGLASALGEANEPPAAATPSPASAGSPTSGPTATSTPGPTATSGPMSTPTSTLANADWWAVLATIDSARSGALSDRDTSALGRYAVPGSSAWDTDAALISQLEERGVRPVGLSTQVVAVEVARWEDRGTSPAPDGTGGQDATAASATVALVVVDQRSGYRMVDNDGEIVDQVPPSGRNRWRVRLAATAQAGGEAGWRLIEVEEVTS